MAQVARGEFGDAVPLLERNVALEGDLRYERFGGAGIQSAFSGAWLAELLSQLGRFDEAIEHADAAMQIAADHPWTLSQAFFLLGEVQLRRGDLPRATQILERGLALCRTWHFVTLTPFVAATLGAAYALAGRADEARPLVASAIEEFRSRPTHIRPAHVLLCAGTTSLSAERIDEARSHAREALALSRRLGPGLPRPTPSASLVTSRRPAARRTRAVTTARRWPSPTSSACAPWRRAAISRWVCSTGARGDGRAQSSISAPRRQCAVTWICASGWSRQRRD